ncbi:MAG TPA: cupin [Candidatus Angelobacter sp.]|nr:cupin [Candidatus Angelobacter sp.]
MPTLIKSPTRIQAAGNMPKLIDEYIGRVNTPDGSRTGNSGGGISVAHMRSPAGWMEPGQTPEFEEFTIVLRGRLRVHHKAGTFDVAAGQAVIAHPGEWIQYSTPNEATEYIAICMPAFSMDTVHRDPDK